MEFGSVCFTVPQINFYNLKLWKNREKFLHVWKWLPQLSIFFCSTIRILIGLYQNWIQSLNCIRTKTLTLKVSWVGFAAPSSERLVEYARLDYSSGTIFYIILLLNFQLVSIYIHCRLTLGIDQDLGLVSQVG